jgi:hypothetical protein
LTRFSADRIFLNWASLQTLPEKRITYILKEVEMFNISILGGSDLGRRPWKPGKKLWTISLLGGTKIDFQQAQLEEGETKVVCISFLGGIHVIVPRDLPVTLSGGSLLGGRKVKLVDVGTRPSTLGKSLHVAAFAILGGVAVKPPKKS